MNQDVKKLRGCLEIEFTSVPGVEGKMFLYLTTTISDVHRRWGSPRRPGRRLVNHINVFCQSPPWLTVAGA